MTKKIKSTEDKVLFSHECENNTIKTTLIAAINTRADLSYADLRGADLSYADLRGANLHGANLSYADLRGANLHGANLSYADLSYADLRGANLNYAYLHGAKLYEANIYGADLSYANLSYADLRGANLSYTNLSYADLRGADIRGTIYKEGITINKAVFIDNLYTYQSAAIICSENKHYIKLGCHTRLVSEWEQDFWNNTEEFPNDNSIKSKLRLFAYETCKRWLEINS